MAVKTYRKTALVTAEQFLPGIGQIPEGVYSDGHGDPRVRQDCNWVLDTKEGRHTLRGGDYICTGPAGEQWNVAQEIFEATYEEAALTLKDDPGNGSEADPVTRDELSHFIRDKAESHKGMLQPDFWPFLAMYLMEEFSIRRGKGSR